MPAVAAAICGNKYCSGRIARGRCRHAAFNPEHVIDCGTTMRSKQCVQKRPDENLGWDIPNCNVIAYSAAYVEAGSQESMAR